MNTAALYAVFMSMGFMPADVPSISNQFLSERAQVLVTGAQANMPGAVKVYGFWNGYFIVDKSLYMQTGGDGKKRTTQVKVKPSSFGLTIGDFDDAINGSFTIGADESTLWEFPAREVVGMIRKSANIGPRDLKFVPETADMSFTIRGHEPWHRNYLLTRHKTGMMNAEGGAEAADTAYVPDSSLMIDVGSRDSIRPLVTRLKLGMDPALRKATFAADEGEEEEGMEEKNRPSEEKINQAPVDFPKAWEIGNWFFSRMYRTYAFNASQQYLGPGRKAASPSPLSYYLLVAIPQHSKEAVVVTSYQADPSLAKANPRSEQSEPLAPAKVVKLDMAAGEKDKEGREKPPMLNGFDIDAETFLNNIVARNVMPKGGYLECVRNDENPTYPAHDSICQFVENRWVIHVGSTRTNKAMRFLVRDAKHKRHTWEVAIEYSSAGMPMTTPKYAPITPTEKYMEPR